MDRSRDKPPQGPRDSRDSQDSRDPKGKQNLTPGNVTVDSRGRNVWHFHGESIDSTSMMLQKLENPSLALEPTRKTRQLDAGSDAPGGKGPAGKASTGKASPGKASAGKDSPTGKSDFGGTSDSFEQRYQLKPGGKNRGGGFDPYNRS
jgi:hypothetical protein